MNDRSARALLGVSPSATTGQIKRAYRRLALERHPDRGGDPTAFQNLVEAQRLLLAQPAVAPREARPVRWETARSTVVERQTSTRMGSARRRFNGPPPARPRQFGDVLAEKLAAA